MDFIKKNLFKIVQNVYFTEVRYLICIVLLCLEVQAKDDIFIFAQNERFKIRSIEQQYCQNYIVIRPYIYIYMWVQTADRGGGVDKM